MSLEGHYTNCCGDEVMLESYFNANYYNKVAVDNKILELMKNRFKGKVSFTLSTQINLASGASVDISTLIANPPTATIGSDSLPFTINLTGGKFKLPSPPDTANYVMCFINFIFTGTSSGGSPSTPKIFDLEISDGLRAVRVRGVNTNTTAMTNGLLRTQFDYLGNITTPPPAVANGLTITAHNTGDGAITSSSVALEFIFL